MRKNRFWRPLIAALSVVGVLGAIAPAASATPANEEPMWVFQPKPPAFPLFEPVLPPPVGELYGPCGAAVDSGGKFYISDYYHSAVHVWDGTTDFSYGEGERPPTGGKGYVTSYMNIDPEDGPCGLALDASNNLYVNDYHRSVLKIGGPVISGQGVDSTHPTGVDVDPVNGVVYVDSRTYVSAYTTAGPPVMDGGNPLKIGVGTLEDGYGVAYSRYPGTLGRLYVPDAGSNTVKVYDPAVSKVNPVAEIDGSDTPNGKFISLRDAAIAIDRVTGEIYVVDNLQPNYTEKPNAVVYIFQPSGAYEGHLKYTVGDGMPVGLAVDNSGASRDPAGTQGRVYVTTGNTEPAAIYGYHADAASTEPITPGAFAGPYKLTVSISGTGSGSVLSNRSTTPCAAICAESLPWGTVVTLTAEPDDDSAFSGWSGGCGGMDATCTVTVDGAVSARAEFSALSAPPADVGGQSTPSGAAAVAAPAATSAPSARPRRKGRHHRRHGRHHRRGRHHRAQ